MIVSWGSNARCCCLLLILLILTNLSSVRNFCSEFLCFFPPHPPTPVNDEELAEQSFLSSKQSNILLEPRPKAWVLWFLWCIVISVVNSCSEFRWDIQQCYQKAITASSKDHPVLQDFITNGYIWRAAYSRSRNYIWQCNQNSTLKIKNYPLSMHRKRRIRSENKSTGPDDCIAVSWEPKTFCLCTNDFACSGSFCNGLSSWCSDSGSNLRLSDFITLMKGW